MRGGMGIGCGGRMGGEGAGRGDDGDDGGAAGAGAIFISDIHWLARVAASPILTSGTFKPLNSAPARDINSPAMAPMLGICRAGGGCATGLPRAS